MGNVETNVRKEELFTQISSLGQNIKSNLSNFDSNRFNAKNSQTCKLVYGEYLIKGYRDEMEDYGRSVIRFSEFYKSEGPEKYFPAFFSLFDGHSGHLCAEYISDNLPSLIANNSNFPDKIPQALKESFIDLDKQFLKDVAVPNSHPDGTTAIVTIIWEEVIYVANCGDCRAVLCQDGEVIEMS